MESGMLVLTEGGGGATLYTARGKLEKVSYPVANIIDTVGAGDTFHSAFLASLYRADAIRRPYRETDTDVLGDAVDFACAAAAINVSRAGCSPPTQEEVESYRRSVKR
jgi:fructokinase